AAIPRPALVVLGTERTILAAGHHGNPIRGDARGHEVAHGRLGRALAERPNCTRWFPCASELPSIRTSWFGFGMSERRGEGLMLTSLRRRSGIGRGRLGILRPSCDQEEQRLSLGKVTGGTFQRIGTFLAMNAKVLPCRGSSSTGWQKHGVASTFQRLPDLGKQAQHHLHLEAALEGLFQHAPALR